MNNRFAVINFSPNLNIRRRTIKLRQLKAMFTFTTLRLHLHTIEYRMPLIGEFRLEIFQFPYWLSNPKFRPPALSFGAQKKFRSESLTVSIFSLQDTTIFFHVCLFFGFSCPGKCAWNHALLMEAWMLFFSRTHENMGKLKRRENCSIRRVVVGGCARHPRRWNYPHKHRAHIPPCKALLFCHHLEVRI